MNKKQKTTIYALDYYHTSTVIEIKTVCTSLAEAEKIAKTDKKYKIRMITV